MAKQANLSENELPSGLSQPALRALAAAGITNLEQVSAHSEQEILSLHGVGPKAIKVLQPALAARGLSFAVVRPPSQRGG